MSITWLETISSTFSLPISDDTGSHHYFNALLLLLHCLLEFTQTHVHWIGDVIQLSSSSVTPFSSHLQSFPASGSFPMSWFIASGGQSIGTSTSASILPMNIQDRFPLGLNDLISSSTTILKHQFFRVQPSLWSSSHIRTWLQEKPPL